MRRNVLNWCNLVSISKKLMFYEFGVVKRKFLGTMVSLFASHADDPVRLPVMANFFWPSFLLFTGARCDHSIVLPLLQKFTNI